MTDSEFKEMFRRIEVARKAIISDLKARFDCKDTEVKPADKDDLHRWFRPQPNYFSGSGEMACPVCKTGRLRYSRSGYNGHVHASCSTEGCVRWME